MNSDYKAIESYIAQARIERSAYLGTTIAESLASVVRFFRSAGTNALETRSIKRLAVPATDR
jgi:hypothetical protein